MTNCWPKSTCKILKTPFVIHETLIRGVVVCKELVFNVFKQCRRWSPAGQIDWPKFSFLQTKATQFWAMMTTVNENTTIHQRYRMNLLCRSVFRLFYCRTLWVTWFTIDVHVSSSVKLRLNDCVCDFYVLVPYFVVLDIHLRKVY